MKVEYQKKPNKFLSHCNAKLRERIMKAAANLPIGDVMRIESNLSS